MIFNYKLKIILRVKFQQFTITLLFYTRFKTLKKIKLNLKETSKKNK